MKTYITLLQEMLDSNVLSERHAAIISVLLAAVNDWPIPTETLEDYIEQVEKIAGPNSTKQSLEFNSKKLDIRKDAWKAESLATLLDVFRYYDEGTPLRAVLADLRKISVRQQ